MSTMMRVYFRFIISMQLVENDYKTSSYAFDVWWYINCKKNMRISSRSVGKLRDPTTIKSKEPTTLRKLATCGNLNIHNV
jgi:hypothetical protein